MKIFEDVTFTFECSPLVMSFFAWAILRKPIVCEEKKGPSVKELIKAKKLLAEAKNE